MEVANQRKIPIVELVNSFKESIRYLFSKWLLIVIVAFVFGVIGILYAWLQKPDYIAEMTFVTETESSSKLGAYAGIAAQFGFDIGGGTNNIFEGDNLIELLRSKNLIQKTLLTNVNGQLLIDAYISSNKINAGWDKDPKYQNVRFETDPSNNTRIEDSLLQVVTKNISEGSLDVYKKDKRLSLIVAKMKSGDEAFSKNFIERLAVNAIQYYTDYKSKKSRQNVQILQRQVDSVKGMLTGSISEVASATDLNVNPARQSLITPAQRKQVDVQVNAALYTELLKNLELAKLTMQKETPLIQIIDTPKYPLEKKKLGRLLAGIAFGFIGGLFTVIYLIIRSWWRKLNSNTAKI